jgi:hypothetical protein
MRSTETSTMSHRSRPLVPLLTRVRLAAAAAAALAVSLLAAAAPAGASTLTGVVSAAARVVWDGTDLVTAAAGANGVLYAYEQVPGASGWSAQVVAAEAPDGGAMGPPSVTVTSSAVQVISEDPAGRIWFFQQIIGESGWSAGQLVGSVSQGNAEGAQYPKIAWTGVAGHAGSNSVITVADGSGDILFWYQNSSGGWTRETVAAGSPPNKWYGAALTATDQGIVIVAAGTTVGFGSFYQAYGSSAPWSPDGTQGGESFGALSVTWDGTNVDVVATYGGSGMIVLWKPDSGTDWNAVASGGGPGSYPFYGPMTITFTGSNLLITAVQQISSSQQRLVFWWQQEEDGEYATFNPETVGTIDTPNGYGTPDLVYTVGARSPEAVIVAPFTANNYERSALDDWTEPDGGSNWTQHTVAPS